MGAIPGPQPESVDAAADERHRLGRVDLGAMVPHRSLDRVEEAYEPFANQRDGVLKVALTP
jgi:threonine dehydrogenase-like Zn-dependent dehydrogenase